MLAFAVERPNLVSLVGLACATAAAYFAILRIFPAAMIGLVWAVAFDWLDGRVARSLPNRTAEQRDFGANLDSLIDVVSFGVVPAIVLLAVGDFSPWLLVPAVGVLGAAVIRLSYFNVFGLVGGSTYRGLALDNNAMILVALFAMRPAIPTSVFMAVLIVVLLILSALNVSTLRTPKLGGSWYIGVVAYAVAASCWFGFLLLRG